MNRSEFSEQIVHVLLGQADPDVVRTCEELCREDEWFVTEERRVRELLTLVREAEQPRSAGASFRSRLLQRIETERRADDAALLAGAGFRDRVSAGVAFVGFRLRQSTSLRVLCAAAALSLVALTVYLVWGAGRDPVPRSLEMVAKMEEPGSPQSPQIGPPGIAPEPDVNETEPSSPLGPILVDEEHPERSAFVAVVRPAEELKTPEPFEPLPNREVAELRQLTEQNNDFTTMRYLMRSRLRPGANERINRDVRHSLRWLVDQQEEDGSWDPSAGQFGGQPEVRVGISGLALITILVNAEHGIPGGVHRQSVSRGLGFLRSRCSSDKTFGQVRGAGERGRDLTLFNHALATLAITESYVLSGGEDEALLVDALERLDDLRVLRSRRERRPADHTTAPWVAMALETARAAGVPAHIDLTGSARQAESYCAELAGAGAGGDVTASGLPLAEFGAMVTVSALDPLYDDVRDYPDLKPSVDLLLTHLRTPSWREPSTIFFASLDLYQRGGTEWEAWEEEAETVLLDSRDDDGAWDSGYSWDPVSQAGGALYETALNLMTLTLPNRMAR